MITVRRALPILFLACACASSDKDDGEPLLTEEQQAELDRIVEKRMSAVSANVSLGAAQREAIKPIMQRAKREFILASRAYRADPTPKNMEKFQAKMRELGLGLRRDLQPHMTSAQRNQFLVVVDQVIQDVRAAQARGQ